MAKGHKVVNVSLTSSTKEALDRLCEQHGMTQKALLGRLIEWFTSQEKTSRAIVLGQITLPDLQEFGAFWERHLAEIVAMKADLDTLVDRFGKGKGGEG